ncbi:O-antigen polymerase [Vibrio breoganii]
MKKKLKYLPGPIMFLSFGFIYYIIAPALLMHFLSDNRYVQIANQYVSPDDYNYQYLIIAIIGYVSFLGAYFLANKINLRAPYFGERLKYYKISPLLIVIALLLIFTLTTVKGAMSGVVFFSGYSNYNISVLGPYATILFSAVIFRNYFTELHIKKMFLILFIFASVFMLGLGSRMFFVLGVIALGLYRLCYYPEIMRKPKFFISLFGGLIFVLAIGVVRGSGELSVTGLLGILFAEPLFTSVSNALYLRSIDDFFVFKLPLDLFSSVINFVPSFVLPNKGEIMNEVGYSLKEFSPFGASGILVNSHINFGVLFFMYFTVTGFIYGALRKLARSNDLFLAIYLSCLPLLMFHFFREGLVTFVKISAFNAIILPIFSVLLLGFLFRRRHA